MSYKVLHVIDYYLQETMNWVEELMIQTENQIDHSIAAVYNSQKYNRFRIISGFGTCSSYPPGLLKKTITRLNQSTYEKNLIDYVKENQIDAVHFHFGHIAIRFINLFAKLNCKKFVSLYGFDYEYLVHKNIKTLSYYQSMSAQGTHFIVEGNYSKKLLESYKIPTSQIHIVQKFFNRNRSINHLTLSFPIKILQVATYTEKKGQLQLLESLGQSGLKDNFIVEFYGERLESQYYSELIQTKSKYKLNNVSFGGKLKFPDYLNKLSNTHIISNLSNKSKSADTEGGCPVFIKDAFSLAKPALTTRHCDIPELAVDSYNSFIASENSIQEIIQNLFRVKNLNNRTYLKLCNNAYESALSKIKSDWTQKSLLKAYYEDQN